MPRPPVKRRKSNPQAKRGAPDARVKLQERLANKVIGQRPQDSDDSDRLVTRTRHGRSSRNFEQVFASGGVAKGDKPGVFPTSQERSARLRSDTEEIIRRSRSKSIEAAKERISKSRSNSVVSSKNQVNGLSSPPVIRDSQPQPSDNAQLVAHPTPAGERSVLGSLKPRRRQASILQLIDNDNSSIINPEDEEQFLPDDESTPLNARKAGASRVSMGSSAPSSRKRKLGMDEPARTASDTVLVASTPVLEMAATTPTPEDSMSNAPRSPKRRIVPTYDDDDEIMAPPQSSSPEPSPQKPKSLPPAKHKKKPSVLTTEQLQSLMPSKRRKGTRQRNQLTEFDIPEDSDSIDNHDVEDESAFLPNKKATKSRGKSSADTTFKHKANGAVVGRAKRTTAATPAGKTKQNSKSTSTPLKVTTPRTPLPLTRNANQENKTLSLARNRNFKSNGERNGIAPTKSTSKRKGNQVTPNGNMKRSGGSHLFATGAESDKENTHQTVNAGQQRTTRSSARLFGKHTTLADSAVKGIQPSIEPTDNEYGDSPVDAMNVDLEVPQLDHQESGDGSVQFIDETPTEQIERGALSADVKAWKSRWGDIDQWDLDYEEVSISAGSDSPLRVSVV